jgi:hypothetical protein
VFLKVAMHLQLLKWCGKRLDTHTQTMQPFTYKLESKISFSLLPFTYGSCDAYTMIKKANKYSAIHCLQFSVTQTIGKQWPNTDGNGHYHTCSTYGHWTCHSYFCSLEQIWIKPCSKYYQTSWSLLTIQPIPSRNVTNTNNEDLSCNSLL